jgi:hypothetical protein
MSKEISKIETQEQGLAQRMEGFHVIEEFTKQLNRKPLASSIQKTPDGKSEELPISFVETKLDEIYLRQWGEEAVSFTVVANEICCDLILWVIDPQTKIKITRSGTAALPIMMDAVPDRLKFSPGPAEAEETKRERNMWALDMQNKKPGALKMQRAAVKQLAIKNAAKSLGKVFGRDLNRKHEDNPGDFYSNLASDLGSLTDALKELDSAQFSSDFDAIWARYPELHEESKFQMSFMYYKRKNIK